MLEQWLELSPDAILVVGPGNNVTRANGRFLEMWGIFKDEAGEGPRAVPMDSMA